MEMPPTDMTEEEIMKTIAVMKRMRRQLEDLRISSHGWILKILNTAHTARLGKIPKEKADASKS